MSPPLHGVGHRPWVALLAVAVFFAQGCSWVRPVTLTPPLPSPPPPRYLEAPTSQDERLSPRADEAGGGPSEKFPTEGDGRTTTQKSNPAQDPWWPAFNEPALDTLIQDALFHNFSVRDLRGIYHEDLLVKERPNGPLWPLQIGIPVSIQRARSSSPSALGGPASSLTINEADVGLTATYQLDIWGQLDLQGKLAEDRARVQALFAESEAQNTAVQVAQVWFEILAQRALLDLLEHQLHLNEDLQSLVKGRFELHLATRLAVLQQEQLLLNTRAQVPLIHARLALLGSQLTSVLGRQPTPYTALVPRDRRLPELPLQTPAGVPADLVKSNPEVRVAQLRVAEAEHRVSQNLSSWLPQISLFLNAGLQTFDFQHGSFFQTWSFGARLSWPIFDGGQRQIEARQLSMTVKRRNLLYQEAFLESVRRVQDAQIQETKQADNVKTLQAEVELGKKVLAVARHLYEQGSSDYLAVLTALSNLSELERTLILARRILLANRIQLYRALGGTWSRSVVEIVD